MKKILKLNTEDDGTTFVDKINELVSFANNHQKEHKVFDKSAEKFEDNTIGYYIDGKRFYFKNSEDFDKFYDKTHEFIIKLLTEKE